MRPKQWVFVGAGAVGLALVLLIALVVYLYGGARTPIRADVKEPPPGSKFALVSIPPQINFAPAPGPLATKDLTPDAKLSPALTLPDTTVAPTDNKNLQQRAEAIGRENPSGGDKPTRADTKDPPPAGAKIVTAPAATAITELEGKDLKKWTAEISDGDPSVREKAIRAVILFGSQAATPSVIDALVARCTSDPEASPRVRAVIALTIIDIPEPERRKVIEALAKCLHGQMENGRFKFDDPQAIVRYHAAVALNRFGDEAKIAIPELINGTRDQSSFETRKACVTALRQVARDPKKGPDSRATHALLYLLASPSGVPNENAIEVKIEAIMSLAAMGLPAVGQPGSEEAKQELKLRNDIEATLSAFLNHRDRRLAIWAHYSQLALIDPNNEAHLKAIAACGTSSDVATRIHTASALGAIGTKGKAYTGVLIKMLGDADNAVFVATCQAFVNMVEPGEQAMKALTALAEAPENVEPKIDPVRKDWAKATLEAIATAKKNKDKMDKDEPKKDKDAKKDK